MALSFAQTRLSPSVHLFEAAQDAATTSPPPSLRPSPKVVILATWMSAQPAHISKYIVGYRKYHPTSRILVVRSSPPDFFYRPVSVQRHRVAPAVSTILSSCAGSAPASTTYTTSGVSGSCPPEILLHVFSNGGSHSTRNLLQAYNEAVTLTAPSPPTSPPISFPAHVTIFDSCPGRSTFARTVLALSSALPAFAPARFLLLAVIYLVVSAYWLLFIFPGIPDPIEWIRRALNDRVDLMHNERRRCYVYSDADPMVWWQDVEEHAREAEMKGFVVRRERFKGSGHCAHVRVGEGWRYWSIVNEVWQASQK